MTTTRSPARTPARRVRLLLVVGLLVVTAAVLVVSVGRPLPKSPSSSAAWPPSTASLSASHPHRGGHRGVGEADGVVRGRVTVFDDKIPAVAGLDPALLGALRRAAKAAAHDGVEFYVTSGRRSPAYQDQLLREAVAEYGSEEAAARWVATAATSPHVSGDAVDIGRSDATAWLSSHGAAYGLCQIYRNEPWHYELRAEATGGGCPRMYADPTQDPRMRR